MNSKWLGDSYDLVKRVLLEAVKNIGLNTYVDPMFTEIDQQSEKLYYKLLKVKHFSLFSEDKSRFCLFLDPDTGVSHKKSKRHITYDYVYQRLKEGYKLVMVYDQSFIRSKSKHVISQIQDKFKTLDEYNIKAFYYISHTKFLFATLDRGVLKKVERELLNIGIPPNRIVKSDSPVV